MFDRRQFDDDVARAAPAIVASGVVPGPPGGRFAAGRADPLAPDGDTAHG